MHKVIESLEKKCSNCEVTNILYIYIYNNKDKIQFISSEIEGM